MESKIISLVFIAVMVCSPRELLADGAETELLLVSGKKAGEELLAVREHSLLLSTLVGATDTQLQTSEGAFVEVPTASIQSVTLMREGNSHAAVGALAGGVMGVGVGYLISKPKSEDALGQAIETSFSMVSIATCALLGAGLGALVGSVKGDKVIEAPFLDPDFVSLSRYARYQSGEPEFLKTKVPRVIE